MFNKYLKKWNLTPDGEAMITRSSQLLPVIYNSKKAMLKIALEQEEKLGCLLMSWWEGDGAARVYASDDDAILLERADDVNTLFNLSNSGNDEQACGIICDCIAKLHSPRNKPLLELTALKKWFQDLEPAAKKHGGILSLSACIAGDLLDYPRDVVVLHGDIHHNNILDFHLRGWLAIDPKGLIGERGFDYANVFCNPDPVIATDSDIFVKRLDIITEISGIERDRLLKWILAWSGLSAAWFLSDALRQEAKIRLTVAELAARELTLSY